MTDTLDALYEELVYLDELFSHLNPQLSPYETARVEARRKSLKAEIAEVESLSSRWG